MLHEYTEERPNAQVQTSTKATIIGKKTNDNRVGIMTILATSPGSRL